MAVSVSGTRVTFTPPDGATALLGDFTDWTKRAPLPVVGGQPITLTLPRGAWVEYAWLGEDNQPFADPDNAAEVAQPLVDLPPRRRGGRVPTPPAVAG